MPRAELERTSGMKSSALAEVIAGRSIPHADNRGRLFAAAVRRATDQLRSWGLPVPRHKLGRLHAYLTARSEQIAPRTCGTCGSPLLQHQATYCDRACKQRSYRARSAELARLSGLTYSA